MFYDRKDRNGMNFHDCLGVKVREVKVLLIEDLTDEWDCKG